MGMDNRLQRNLSPRQSLATTFPAPLKVCHLWLSLRAFRGVLEPAPEQGLALR